MKFFTRERLSAKLRGGPITGVARKYYSSKGHQEEVQECKEC
jgi:hypothetical protein